MLTIPAIDLSNSKVVRLEQGKLENKTEYSDDPSKQASLFQKEGAKLIHVVDLDGAFDGHMKNLNSIKEIINSIDIPIEVGGGIRSYQVVKELLDIGVKRVIIGTMAINNQEEFIKILQDFGGEKIVLGVDAQDGYIATHGWKNITTTKAYELVEKYKPYGLERILYTDIARDGMLQGPNYKAIKELLDKTEIKIIASGGISSLEDIKELKKYEEFGVESFITGKAIYENRFTVAQAIEVSGE